MVDSHYPSNNEKNRNGYTYTGSELKGSHFAGVEFYDAVIDGYRVNETTFRKCKVNEMNDSTAVFATDVIPYKWIESIDLRGDDTSYRPQLYVHFKGKDKYPFKTTRYYIKDSEGLQGFTEINFQK